MTIDLHTHTVFSDGTDEPDVWWAAVRDAGVRTVAVTDHDTTAGWEALARTRPPDMTLVPGAEISARVRIDDRMVSMHLLAYLFDPAEPVLAAELQRLRQDRRRRGLAIVERMISGGVPITREQVLRIAAGAPVGRPHIARALMEAGLVSSVSEAFADLLSGRGPYYVHKADTDLLRAIDLVRGAGGVPVLAHPRSRGAARWTDEAMLAGLADAGLAGIEVDHPDHGAADRRELRRIAATLGLVVTGSSDYHGANKMLRPGQDVTAAEELKKLVAQASAPIDVIGPGGW